MTKDERQGKLRKKDQRQNNRNNKLSQVFDI